MELFIHLILQTLLLHVKWLIKTIGNCAIEHWDWAVFMKHENSCFVIMDNNDRFGFHFKLVKLSVNRHKFTLSFNFVIVVLLFHLDWRISARFLKVVKYFTILDLCFF
jgi:hypothetical protein